MNISARLAGTAGSRRLGSGAVLIERLRADIERVQATLPSDRTHDAESLRAALALAPTRLDRRLG